MTTKLQDAAAAGGAGPNGTAPPPAAAAAAPAAAAPAATGKAGTPPAEPAIREASPANGGAPPPGANGSAANGATPAPDAVDAARAATASPGPGPESAEAAEARKREDELVARGAEIAGVRALLARAFSKPAAEPERSLTHWEFLLREAAWLAADVAQERLWKRATALAFAFEIARKGGAFGLRPPPKPARRFHDEIRELRAAAARDAAPAPPPTGRRSAAREAAKAGAAAAGASSALALDPASDPAFADLEAGAAALGPGTPPLGELAAALAYPCADAGAFADALEAQLMRSDLDRVIAEETACRAHRLEYEAALVSHQMAVAEARRQANAIGLVELDLGGALGGEEGGDDGYGAAAKKGAKRRKAGRAAGGGGGADRFLGLEDFGGGEEGYGGGAGGGYKRAPKTGEAGVEDVYLRKKRPQRTPAYREADADYEAAADTGARYGTRRATGALRTSQRAAAGRHRAGPGGRSEGGYPAGAAGAAGRVRGGHPGMVLWSRAEDDLLLAIVHEFCINWTLVSEVLSLSMAAQGVHRSPAQCRQRFRQLMVRPPPWLLLLRRRRPAGCRRGRCACLP
jgi:hypothetical protein